MAQLDSRCLHVSQTEKRMICYRRWTKSEQLRRLLPEAKRSASGKQVPVDSVLASVAVLDPENDLEAEAVRAHLEELARVAERRPEKDHG